CSSGLPRASRIASLSSSIAKTGTKNPPSEPLPTATWTPTRFTVASRSPANSNAVSNRYCFPSRWIATLNKLLRPYLLLALACGVVAVSQHRARDAHATLRIQEDIYPLPPPAQTVVRSLGYLAALAE